jgi:hypothetical protein
MPDLGPCRGLSRREAARWLVNTDAGRQWARARGGSMAEMTRELCALSASAAGEVNARRLAATATKEAPMSTETILKNLKAMGEHEFVRVVTKAAKAQYPQLPAAVAFTKLFTSDDSEGAAIRAAWLISKGVVDADGPEAQYMRTRTRGVAGGALDPDEVADEAEDEQDDALDALNELAAQERRRNPKLSKAQSFAKIYVDPSNARLAQRERAQSRRRLGVA